MSTCFVLIPSLIPPWSLSGGRYHSGHRLDVEVCLTHHRWSSIGLRDEGGQGHGVSSFQANHSAGLITIPTRCSFQWWSVPLWSTVHSLTLLFYAYLSFIMWCLRDTWVCRSLQVCSIGCYDLRSVAFCSAADKAVIIWDDRGKEKTGKMCQSSFPQLISCGVNNSNVSWIWCA